MNNQKLAVREKIITIKNMKYKIGKLDARSASYLAMKMAAIIAPFIGKGSKNIDESKMAEVLPNIPRNEFDEIQTMLLRKAFKLRPVGDADMPEPILRADGSFVDDDMAYDAATVINLTVQVLFFNIGDFFTAAGSMLNPEK